MDFEEMVDETVAMQEAETAQNLGDDVEGFEDFEDSADNYPDDYWDSFAI